MSRRSFRRSTRLVTKIDPYNYELYRFKVAVFFETQYSMCPPTPAPAVNRYSSFNGHHVHV